MEISPIQKICDYLIARSHPSYNENCGYCARMVRQAVLHGLSPKVIDVVESAKDYGPSYEKVGFKKVFSFPVQKKEDYKAQIGDIAIINYEPHGHICVYVKGVQFKTGKNIKCWISDFQQIDMYGGKSRLKNPPFSIYRLTST
jgi:hypothetical protein